MKKKLRFALALVAALSLLTITAFALFPSLRELIQLDLGPKAPYATEMLASCEDQGITIEAQSALTDGRMTRLYFTIHDPSGVFFLEDTSNDLQMNFQAETEPIWGVGGEGLKLISYDPNTHTGLYMYSTGTYYGTYTTPTQATLSMRSFIPGFRYVSNAEFSGPAPFDHATLPTALLASTAENAATVLLPYQNPHFPFENCPEVFISSMGFSSDGCYHIRFQVDSGLTQAYSNEPYSGPSISYHLFDPVTDPDVPQHAPRSYDAVATAVPDGWDYCLSELTEESYERMGLLVMESTYSLSGGIREGHWELTFPVTSIANRTTQPSDILILSRTKDSPPPSGRNDEAQVAKISVSPLSVVVDFVTPEGHMYPCAIIGAETACAIELADGTVSEPIYYSDSWGNRTGWIMWEFDEPIDPDEVVSVSLNGNEIPFD